MVVKSEIESMRVAAPRAGIAETDWCKYLIARDVHARVVTYSFAEKIPDPPEGTLGIVMSGTLEICDEKRLHKDVGYGRDYIAYRPIRIMAPGEFFNDFPIFDTLLSIPHPAVATGEKWSLYAGSHCILVMSGVSTLPFINIAEGWIEPAIFLEGKAKENTTIAYVSYDPALFNKDNPFSKEFIRQCWSKINAYRFGLNSYNQELITNFRDIVEDAWDYLERAGKWARTEHYSKKTRKTTYRPCGAVAKSAKTTILPIMSDALFDAIWRPVRGDPVFAHQANKITVEKTSGLPKSFDATRVLTACRIEKCNDPFFYPIDLHNIDINSHCGRKRTRIAAIEALRFDRKSSKSKENLRSRDFYLDLANECISEYLAKEELKAYPYEVRCIDSECLVGRMLLLEFLRKPPAK